ncbi:hypothetical protein ICN84_10315 [Akkermansia glycaniphila]|uniref:hypothetical protein n=1 Tax=Akkermansia glycaniphila TaxID=1679444 RepID=UPI001C01023F|nr:hypothetical protein [Akkermansia glycaniphila]MBT9450461.1 hypothetical protein [Akkermansia glycaniphila]
MFPYPMSRLSVALAGLVLMSCALPSCRQVVVRSEPSVVLSPPQKEAKARELVAAMKSLPAYALHECSIAVFHDMMDRSLVRFGADGNPWLDYGGNMEHPESRCFLENGGDRLRIVEHYRGFGCVGWFGEAETVYERRDGRWVEVSCDSSRMVQKSLEGLRASDVPDPEIFGKMWLSGGVGLLQKEDGTRISLKRAHVPAELWDMLLRRADDAGGGDRFLWVYGRVEPAGGELRLSKVYQVAEKESDC